MWFAKSIERDVDEVVIIRYVGRAECKRWNEHRRDGEMRLFTGWSWFARYTNSHQQGLKSKSACYRDAYYQLILRAEPPRLPKLVRVA